MSKINLFLIFILVFGFNVFSKSEDDKEKSRAQRPVDSKSPSEIDPFNPKALEQLMKQMQQGMEEDKKLFEKYFNSKMLKRFENMFNGFDKMLDQQKGPMSGVLGDVMNQMLQQIPYQWLESHRHRTLVLQLGPKQVEKYEYVIKNGDLKITQSKKVSKASSNPKDVRKVKVEEKTHYKFEQTISIPPDVEANNPQFENTKTELKIVFPKKNIKPLKKQKLKI